MNAEENGMTKMDKINEFSRRFDALAIDDVEGVRELAKWAEQNELHALAHFCRRAAEQRVRVFGN